MYKSIRIILITLLLFCFSIVTTNAQSNDDKDGPVFKCFPSDLVIKYLTEEGLTHIAAAGLDEQGNLMRLFSSNKGEWQVIITLAQQNLSCPLTFGYYLTTYERKGETH
tara:strand:+ start:1100 stop:1426 length:327 start_codon:yes stop_codon:yes gene_type:complete